MKSSKELPCVHCGKMFVRTDWQIAGRNYICLECKNEYYRRYWKMRKEIGKPLKSGRSSTEHKREYDRERFKNPINREKRNAKARRRYNSECGRTKAICRAMTRHYVRTGILVKLPCHVCGSLLVEAHHSDYSNPRLVKWLCTEHHREEHKSAARKQIKGRK